MVAQIKDMPLLASPRVLASSWQECRCASWSRRTVCNPEAQWRMAQEQAGKTSGVTRHPLLAYLGIWFTKIFHWGDSGHLQAILTDTHL